MGIIVWIVFGLIMGAMDWVVGVALVVWLGSSMAQEGASPQLEWSALEATRAYDAAVVHFNTHPQEFASWKAFQEAVWATIGPGALGRCYAQTGRPMQPVEITEMLLPRESEDGWQPTAGKGWQREVAARTFIEYRVNTKARVVLRHESVKPWWFFAHTRQICEFPL
jgi:hypothetical protein